MSNSAIAASIIESAQVQAASVVSEAEAIAGQIVAGAKAKAAVIKATKNAKGETFTVGQTVTDKSGKKWFVKGIKKSNEQMLLLSENAETAGVKYAHVDAFEGVKPPPIEPVAPAPPTPVAAPVATAETSAALKTGSPVQYKGKTYYFKGYKAGNKAAMLVSEVPGGPGVKYVYNADVVAVNKAGQSSVTALKPGVKATAAQSASYNGKVFKPGFKVFYNAGGEVGKVQYEVAAIEDATHVTLKGADGKLYLHFSLSSLESGLIESSVNADGISFKPGDWVKGDGYVSKVKYVKSPTVVVMENGHVVDITQNYGFKHATAEEVGSAAKGGNAYALPKTYTTTTTIGLTVDVPGFGKVTEGSFYSLYGSNQKIVRIIKEADLVVTASGRVYSFAELAESGARSTMVGASAIAKGTTEFVSASGETLTTSAYTQELTTWSNGLRGAERDAVKHWSENGYAAIRAALTGKSESALARDSAQAFVKALEKAPHIRGRVWRGIQNVDTSVFQPGSTVEHYPGQSWTTKRGVAEGFAGGSSAKGSVIFECETKGMVDIKLISSHQSENEVVAWTRKEYVVTSVADRIRNISDIWRIVFGASPSTENSDVFSLLKRMLSEARTSDYLGMLRNASAQLEGKFALTDDLKKRLAEIGEKLAEALEKGTAKVRTQRFVMLQER